MKNNFKNKEGGFLELIVLIIIVVFLMSYFFLDSSIPMIHLLHNKYNIACRFSEYEPIEFYNNIKNMIFLFIY